MADGDLVVCRARPGDGQQCRLVAHAGHVVGSAALPPLLAVTNVPVMLARLTARSVVVPWRSAAASRFSRRGTSAGVCARAGACPLESVIGCSPRALARRPARQKS
jgi:hypothetical protein